MATGKKSFILYADLITSFKHLSKEDVGELFIHILEYVNDMKPVSKNGMVNLAFEPIKNQFKRDLEKWDNIKEKRSLAGKKSAELRANKRQQDTTNPTSVESVEQNPTNTTVTVNDTVTVTVNDTVIKKKEEKKSFNFRKSLIDLNVSEDLALGYLEIRKKRKSPNSEVAFNILKNKIKNSKFTPSEIITTMIDRNWLSFKDDWIEREFSKNNFNKQPDQNKGLPTLSFGTNRD
jgi:hypothetical protein